MDTQEERALKREIEFQRRQRAVFMSRFDATTDATPFLERQIVQLRTKIFNVEFAPTLARTFAPIATDIAPYANMFSYAVYEAVGQAKIGSYKGNDNPRVEVNAREVFGKVVPITDAFGWDIQEMAEAARLSQDISGMKMKAARDVIEFGIDKVLAFGSIPDETGVLPALGLGGIVNNAAVVAQGITALGFWPGGAVTPSTIIAQLGSMISSVAIRTNGAYKANTLLLPTAHYEYIAQTPFSTLNGVSILSVFKQNNPGVTMIAPWWKLNTAGAAGVPRAVAYQRTDTVLELVLPLDFTMMPPEAQTFEMLYNCHARCGGAQVYRPFGMTYGDFATS